MILIKRQIISTMDHAIILDFKDANFFKLIIYPVEGIN